MARFADWWSASGTTVADVAGAASRAGVLVDTGDFAIGWLDFGDGGAPAPIRATGSVCTAGGATWLVYPGGSEHIGWLAQPAEIADDGQVRLGSLVVELGKQGAEQILTALIDAGKAA